MIRGRTSAALAVRRPDGAIVRHRLPLSRWANGRARKVPLVRGVLVLLETLVAGMKALSLSANEAADDGKSAKAGKESQALSTASMTTVMVVALAAGVALFFILPLFVSRGAEDRGALFANVVEGLLRLVIFLGYIWAIGQLKDIQRVFGYHGAEHMAVSAHENGKPLTIGSLRRFPTAHPRCGTSFLLTVVLVSIIVFMFIPRDPLWLVIVSRVVLIPVIAAVSYELIRFSGAHLENGLVRLLTSPNLLLQKMTTRQPDDRMLEVAIDAMSYAIAMDEGRVDGGTGATAETAATASDLAQSGNRSTGPGC